MCVEIGDVWVPMVIWEGASKRQVMIIVSRGGAGAAEERIEGLEGCFEGRKRGANGMPAQCVMRAGDRRSGVGRVWRMTREMPGSVGMARGVRRGSSEREP